MNAADSSLRSLAQPGFAAEGFAFAHRLNAPIWVYDIDHSRIVHANSGACQLWQAPDEATLQARDLGTDMSATVARRLKQYQADFEAGDPLFNEMWTLYPKGVPTSVMVFYRGYRLPDGRMAMLCEVAGEAENEPQNLRSAEALLHTDVMIGLFGENGRPLYMNPAARNAAFGSQKTLREIFNEPSDFATLLLELDATGSSRLITQVRSRSGYGWFDISAKVCSDAVTGETATLLTAIDVSELKIARDKARYLADRDQLTGCYNRTYLQSQIAAFPADGSDAPCAILYFDVDRFKQINDVFGHETGDTVLRRLAVRGLSAIRRNDLMARLGGDEFVIVLRDAPDTDILMREVERIRRAISQPVLMDALRIDVTVTVGVSLFYPETSSFTEIMRQADLALYAGKQAGRNRATLFDDEMGAAASARDRMELELREALHNREFILHYQPRIDLATGDVISVEALVRWRHPKQGLVPPDRFIPICEETGMIGDLGQQVLEMGFEQARAWQAEGRRIDLSINISPRQFNDNRLMQTLSDYARDAGFPRDRVELEITENVLIGDPQVIAEKLHRITELGYRIAIDDFGTGYSNLSYILQFPLHCIKIDRSFIDQLPASAPIVDLILTLSEKVDAVVVAEGVETAEQMAWLREKACDQAQGYFLSRPVPLSDLPPLLDRKLGAPDPG